MNGWVLLIPLYTKHNNSSRTYICVFIVTVRDEKHLPNLIHAAEQQWQLPLKAKGHESHTQKLQRFIRGKALSTTIPPDKWKQIKPTNNQTHLFFTGQSQESFYSLPRNTLQSTAQGRLSRAAVPLPNPVPGTLCCSQRSARCQARWSSSTSSKSVPEMGPEAGEIWAHTSRKLELIIIPTSD